MGSQFHRLVSREKFVKTLCAVFQKKNIPKVQLYILHIYDYFMVFLVSF